MPSGRPPIEIDLEKLKELYTLRWTASQVAAFFNMHEKTLLVKARQFGLQFGATQQFCMFADALPILTMYQDWKWSVKDISILFGFPQPYRQVTAYLKSKNVQIRSNTEQKRIDRQREEDRIADCQTTEITYYIRGKQGKSGICSQSRTNGNVLSADEETDRTPIFLRRVLNKKGEFNERNDL